MVPKIIQSIYLSILIFFLQLSPSLFSNLAKSTLNFKFLSILAKLNQFKLFSSIFFSIQNSIITQKISNLIFAYDAWLSIQFQTPSIFFIFGFL